jgi:hypothetical protein
MAKAILFSNQQFDCPFNSAEARSEQSEALTYVLLRKQVSDKTW